MAAQPALPTKGNVFISVADRQKPKIAEIARGFAELGFTLYATSGTAAALKAAEIPVKKLFKLNEGRPNALDMIKNGELALIINTPERQSRPRGRGQNPQHRDREPHPDHHHPARRHAPASTASARCASTACSVKPLQEWNAAGTK